MASKRNLKKTMHYIVSELLAELYFKSLISDKDIDAECDKLALEILDFASAHIKRVNHCGGTHNPQVVKSYYSKLYSDWNSGISEIIDKMESLS